jgi:hypothetical protein
MIKKWKRENSLLTTVELDREQIIQEAEKIREQKKKGEKEERR